jgi:hypothetical protein
MSVLTKFYGIICIIEATLKKQVWQKNRKKIIVSSGNNSEEMNEI